MDTFAPMPPSGLGAVHNDPEDPIPSLGATGLLSELTDDAIDAMTDAAGPGSGAPLLFAELRHLGGALGRPDPGHGAAGHVEEEFLVHGIGVPIDLEVGRAVHASLERLMEGLAPWTTGRRFLNFIEDRDHVASAFAPATLDRLREVKRRYDPEGRIHSSHPIPGA
jgi:hypothetical protein